MKPYYVMIHFAGPYVTGFIVPQAKDEPHALRILKVMLVARLKISLKNEKESGHISLGNDYSSPRLRELLRTVKRPWRCAGEYRQGKGYKHAKLVSTDKIVKILQLQLPCFSNYWLHGIIEGQLCNQPNTWSVNDR